MEKGAVVALDLLVAVGAAAAVVLAVVEVAVVAEVVWVLVVGKDTQENQAETRGTSVPESVGPVGPA